MKSVLLFGTLLAAQSLHAEEIDYSLCRENIKHFSEDMRLEMTKTGQINPVTEPKIMKSLDANTTNYTYETITSENNQRWIARGVINIVRSENGKQIEITGDRSVSNMPLISKKKYNFDVRNGHCYPTAVNLGVSSDNKFVKTLLSPAKEGLTFKTQHCRDIHTFMEKNGDLKKCSDPAILTKLRLLMDKVDRAKLGSSEGRLDEGKLTKAFKKKIDGAYADVSRAQEYLGYCDQYGLADSVLVEDIWKDEVDIQASAEKHTISK